jgi:hypothetical protein
MRQIFCLRFKKEKRCRRIKNTHDTCGICGKEAETEYHAVLKCPKAAALRSELRKIWDLPKEEDLRYSGQDWVLNIPENQTEETRNKLLFLWWRA